MLWLALALACLLLGGLAIVAMRTRGPPSLPTKDQEEKEQQQQQQEGEEEPQEEEPPPQEEEPPQKEVPVGSNPGDHGGVQFRYWPGAWVDKEGRHGRPQGGARLAEHFLRAQIAGRTRFSVPDVFFSFPGGYPGSAGMLMPYALDDELSVDTTQSEWAAVELM